jgi:hypothetical protein
MSDEPYDPSTKGWTRELGEDGLTIWHLDDARVAGNIEEAKAVPAGSGAAQRRLKRAKAYHGHDPAPPSMLHEDPMPAGPYRRALTKYDGGRTDRPYVIMAANGQCLSGWINSRAAVDAIVAALNAQYPAGDDGQP